MKYYLLLWVAGVCCNGIQAQPAAASNNTPHPHVYVQEGDKQEILLKIKNEPWAKEAWEKIKASVDKYVVQHQQQPDWIISRMSMYWKKGAHYTQCYLAKEHWDYGVGNAPVPTVRLPGMRTWNDYANVPLEKRMPYNESGDMLAFSLKKPAAPPVLVPYQQSGHLIRSNNTEILQLGQRAAFIYWLTGETAYAQFAADIFDTWLAGTYYMQPPLDPERASGGAGGYAPGGICGYYDYEQIHDNLCLEAVPLYDFLYSYLKQHPGKAGKVIGKPLEEVAGIVFKRFIDIGMVRGGKKGNWNVNGWDMMMPGILALESNHFYADGKGREYYLTYYTDSSTAWHDALPDILTAYDAVTGLWGEAPGYGLGTIGSVVNMALPLYKNGVNTIRNNPMIQKATLAMIPWLDARGNMVLFGDMRGGPGNFTAFERLCTYYQWTGNQAGMQQLASLILKGIASGQYSRSQGDWRSLCWNVPLPAQVKTDSSYARVAYSAEHRHITMKNGNDTTNGLMFTLYGGYNRQKHLSPNGLAMQLYGKGWALAPDAAGYESYWSADYDYHQSATGSNTILPGYTAGIIQINAMEPTPDKTAFTATRSVTNYISFADVTAAEKRRMVAMIRTSPVNGFYVDIFRSGLSYNDYLYHNLGNSFTLKNSNGSVPALRPASDLGHQYNSAYSYFSNVRKTPLTQDVLATWTITATQPAIVMDMWIPYDTMRTLYALTAPYTSKIKTVTPAYVNVAPDSTAAILIRQNAADGNQHPFVVVFEPYTSGNKNIEKVTTLAATPAFHALQVSSRQPEGQQNFLLYSIDTQEHLIEGIACKAVLGMVAENANGLQVMYLGSGLHVQYNGYRLAACGPGAVSAAIEKKNNQWYYSATGEVCITLPGKQPVTMPAGNQELLP